jgi:hypothetical protein
MSITTEKMKESLTKFIRNAKYTGDLQFVTAGELAFIDITHQMIPGITDVRISVAGLDRMHPRVKKPYLTYSFEGEANKIEYDQSTDLDNFISKNMNYILTPLPIKQPRRPSQQTNRNLIDRIERLEKSQITMHDLIVQIQDLISVLDSKLLKLEEK